MSETVLVRSGDLFRSTPVDNRFIAELRPAAPGTAVKVYLYGLMLVSGNTNAQTDIATALALTDADVEEAYSYWEKLGAVRIVPGSGGNLTVQYLPIGENAISAEMNRSAQYASLIAKLQAVLGTRNLTGAELQKIYDWIEIFRLEEDAAAEIVRHCIAIKGPRVHINYMDSVAKRLSADGILTLDRIRESFEQEKELSGGASNILKRWRITRRPTEDELSLYVKWTREWGFTDDAIGIALSDVVAVDRPNFKYLDAILASYHSTGCVSPEKMREVIREQDMIAELARSAFIRAGLKRNASVSDRRQFELWVHDYGMNAEIILLAAELASKKNSPFAEMKKIISDWHDRGIASFEAAKDDAAKREEEAARTPFKGKRINRALNYPQKQYTADDLKKFGIDLGEGLYED